MHSTSTSHNTSASPSHQQPREMKLIVPSLRKASTLLSSSMPPPPPPDPCPWLWRCHSCYTIYRLAVTRRCLNCDHTFCLGDAAGAAATEPQGKKRKRGGPCKAEFDYAGWKARGAWRRTVLLNGDGSSSGATGAAVSTAKTSEVSWGDEHEAAARDAPGEGSPFEAKRERLFLRKRHNCFVHCDFPSECHHALFRAQQEGRPILREAEALDAAEEQAARNQSITAGGGKRWARRLTMQEYKQRRADRRGKLVLAAAAASRSDGDLSTVTEEEDYDYDGDESGGDGEVSPCSPTSPDPPGDLMREVSPIEVDGSSDEYPVSPSGGSSRRPSRASLLVTTDTPADFATTAAPLSFDDSCSDEECEHCDDDDDEEDEEQQQRAKSRRKVAQLTGLDLQAAWSEQAWFSSSSTTPEPASPKSPERVSTRDRMLALLGRRGSSSSSPTRASLEGDMHQQQQQQSYQPHAETTAGAGEEWESSSNSSDSSSGSSGSSSGCSLLSSSSTDDAVAAVPAPTMVEDGTDADGDVTMRDAGASSAAKQVDGGSNSSVSPEGAGGDGSEDLRVLFRMRNAFMRGEMM